MKRCLFLWQSWTFLSRITYIDHRAAHCLPLHHQRQSCEERRAGHYCKLSRRVEVYDMAAECAVFGFCRRVRISRSRTEVANCRVRLRSCVACGLVHGLCGLDVRRCHSIPQYAVSLVRSPAIGANGGLWGSELSTLSLSR